MTNLLNIIFKYRSLPSNQFEPFQKTGIDKPADLQMNRSATRGHAGVQVATLNCISCSVRQQPPGGICEQSRLQRTHQGPESLSPPSCMWKSVLSKFYKLCSQIHNAFCPLLIDQLLTVLSFYMEFAFDRDQ